MTKNQLIKLFFCALFAFALSNCSGWSEEDKTAFMKTCEIEGQAGMDTVCECIFNQVKKEYPASKDFKALSESEMETKMVELAGKNSCVTWETPFLVEAISGECKKGDQLGSKEDTEKFCNCTVKQASEKYPNPMKFFVDMQKMDQAKQAEMMSDLAMSCMTWEIAEKAFCSEAEISPEKCQCAMGKVKQSFQSASEFMSSATKQDEKTGEIVSKAFSSCM